MLLWLFKLYLQSRTLVIAFGCELTLWSTRGSQVQKFRWILVSICVFQAFVFRFRSIFPWQKVWTDVRAPEQPKILSLTCQSGNTLFVKWVRPSVFHRFLSTMLIQHHHQHQHHQNHPGRRFHAGYHCHHSKPHDHYTWNAFDISGRWTCITFTIVLGDPATATLSGKSKWWRLSTTPSTTWWVAPMCYCWSSWWWWWWKCWWDPVAVGINGTSWISFWSFWHLKTQLMETYSTTWLDTPLGSLSPKSFVKTPQTIYHHHQSHPDHHHNYMKYIILTCENTTRVFPLAANVFVKTDYA